MKFKKEHLKQTNTIFYLQYMPYLLFLCIISQSLAQDSWGDLYGSKGDIHVTNKDRTDVKAGYTIRGKDNSWLIYKDNDKLGFNYIDSNSDGAKGSFMAEIQSDGTIVAKKEVAVASGNGNGYSFWGGNKSYKIHMGTGAEYRYGDVTSYAIKTNMSNQAGRGWVWGVVNQSPIAALSNSGSLQIKGDLTVEGDMYCVNDMRVGNTVRAKNVVVDNGDGNGFSFSNDNNKIHMGVGANYHYGDVTDSSIKTSIEHGAARGYTWGEKNSPPTASLTNDGTFQIKKDFISEGTIYAETMHIGQNRSHKIANVKLSIDGRLYISENDTHGRGLIETTGPKYEDNLVFVEEGVVSKDFSLAPKEAFPDYVFDADYKLPSLKEIENVILEKGHLHTMPSAEEVAEDGFKVSDMTIRMVTTIEELMLHTIAQEKKIELLLARLKDLEEE
jgi:hypothetical protein